MHMYELLSQQFPDLTFEKEKLLAPYTYFKIGGPAEVFCIIKKAEHLAGVIQYCSVERIPYTILGGMSNIVVNDYGIKGLVIKNELTELKESSSSIDKGIIYAESGLKTALLVSQTVALGYTGLEYFLGIPGTLGGAIYNNGHYLSHLIGDYISRVRIVTEVGEQQWLTHAECEFGYDTSRFHHTREVIIGAEFSLKKGDKSASQAMIKEATQYRATTQPLGTPSSGCIFQNTPNSPTLKKLFPEFSTQAYVPTGFLIDQAGLKGYTIGEVKVSEKHAAWIINMGNGTAANVRDLIQHIKSTVKEKFDTDIQEEVFYIGSQ